MSIGQLIDRFGQLVFLVSVVLRGLLEAVEVFADAFNFGGNLNSVTDLSFGPDWLSVRWFGL